MMLTTKSSTWLQLPPAQCLELEREMLMKTSDWEHSNTHLIFPLPPLAVSQDCCY